MHPDTWEASLTRVAAAAGAQLDAAERRARPLLARIGACLALAAFAGAFIGGLLALAAQAMLR